MEIGEHFGYIVNFINTMIKRVQKLEMLSSFSIILNLFAGLSYIIFLNAYLYFMY